MNREKSINISTAIGDIIDLISKTVPAYNHINMKEILICIRKNKPEGVKQITYGKLLPLHFKDGARKMLYKNDLYVIPRLTHKNHSLKYIIYFYLPSFFDLTAREKLKVIFHELYHINENFNGDIRRMGKRKISHGGSKKNFDDNLTEMVNWFYDYIRGTEHFDFLAKDSATLHSEYQRVLYMKTKQPRPIIIENYQV